MTTSSDVITGLMRLLPYDDAVFAIRGEIIAGPEDGSIVSQQDANILLALGWELRPCGNANCWGITVSEC